MLHVETYGYTIKTGDEALDQVHYMGLNRQVTQINTSFRPERSPVPDPVTVEWASAWIAPAVGSGAFHYLRTAGCVLDIVTMTGARGADWLAPLMAGVSGPQGPVYLKGPLRLPYGIGVIKWASGIDLANYRLMVRVCYA